jgi:hypothetical protein
MSLELIKEAVRLNQPIGEDTIQTIVENDIIVPDVKPDIIRILLLDGDSWIDSAEAASDKILISGTVRYKILYVSDDSEQPIKSINSATGFQYSMDIPETRQGMQCRVKCDIEHMEYDVINSRKVNVKAILNLCGKTMDQTERQITQDFEGLEEIQVLRNTISVNSYIGNSESGCTVGDILEIPAGKPTILEILRSDAKITAKDFKVTEDRIVAVGELYISTLYIADDEMRSIQFMEHQIPFSESIDLAGVDERSYCDIEYDLGEVICEALEDSDGELRQLRCEAMLNIYAECFEKKEVELVEDAYSPYSRVSIEKEELKLQELVTENESQITVREAIEIDENSPDISELFNLLGKLSLSGGEIADDRITVEGVVISNILYLADNEEEPVFCVSRDIPFRHSLDVKGVKDGMGLDVEMDIEHCSYNIISTKEIEVRFVIGLKTRVGRQITVPVVVKATEQPHDENRLEQQPSVTIYFARQDDTLWTIAKKYSTTVDELIMNNELEGISELKGGEQLIIPRKL